MATCECPPRESPDIATHELHIPPMMPGELSDAARIKLALMAGIDEAIRCRHRTLVDVAVATGVNRQQLSRIRQGHHEGLSVSWLLNVAERLGVTLTIDVRISD